MILIDKNCWAILEHVVASHHVHEFETHRMSFPKTKKNRIERETYDEYASRVMETIMNMPKDLIDATIESLPVSVQAINDSKGDRSN